jgi:transcriptional regulator with XRE-family HTH domain
MTPEQLIARRLELGLSQRELAEAIGLDRDTVGGYERGKIAITESRSMWLDAKMADLKRAPGRPKKRRNLGPRPRRRPMPGTGGGEG